MEKKRDKLTNDFEFIKPFVQNYLYPSCRIIKEGAFNE